MLRDPWRRGDGITSSACGTSSGPSRHLRSRAPAALALVTLAAVHWFHECWPGDHAARSRHHPGIDGSAAGVPAERRDPVTSNYVRVTGLDGLFAEARELSVRTMIFDVEPLVAPWHGSQESLDQGIAHPRRRQDGPVGAVVIFATNSARRPSAVRPATAFRSGTWHRPRSRCGPRRTTTFSGRAPWQVISSPPTGYSPIGYGLRSCTTRRS